LRLGGQIEKTFPLWQGGFMYHSQPRCLPNRIYEPNIIHNPFSWMGIWTPHGWRVHQKRWGKAQRLSKRLSGDGKTTFFPEALLDPQSGRVEWQDDLHLKDDPFTDAGIYPSDPRVEYPLGQPRWAISHTLLCYPVADHGLHTHEYTWDMVHGHLQTHFRKHVSLEEAQTDDRDGKTVLVKNRPISRTIEGNIHYPLPNSAVRGVWTNAEKKGTNFYTRRVIQLIKMHNAGYAVAPHVPVVQCFGMYAVLPNDPTQELFNLDSGECQDPHRLIEQFHIPLDEPKIGMLLPPYVDVPSKVYEGTIGMMAAAEGSVDEGTLAELRKRLGTRFAIGRVGYAAGKETNADSGHYRGYVANFDLNNNGVIDEEDEQRFARNLGRRVRFNAYVHAYFGGDWLTTQVCLEPEHRQGIPAIADYEYGGGYDAEAGIVQLLETPGPGRKIWIEYFHDAPAAAGEDNILVHLYREE
jgi:hypothetical protein